jgi:hypothetical protein
VAWGIVKLTEKRLMGLIYSDGNRLRQLRTTATEEGTAGIFVEGHHNLILGITVEGSDLGVDVSGRGNALIGNHVAGCAGAIRVTDDSNLILRNTLSESCEQIGF